jgi:hypothetical protein
MSEPLSTELVDPEPAPNDTLEVGVTNAGEKGKSTPRYNLRPCLGRNFRPMIGLLF